MVACEFTDDGSGTNADKAWGLEDSELRAVLLIAFTPGELPGGYDRWVIAKTSTVGRISPSDFRIADDWVSGKHLEISLEDGDAYIRDLGSTNGTFVNGAQIGGRQRLRGPALIRAGRTIFVFHEDGEAFLGQRARNAFQMAGSFHVTPLLKKLERLALSGSHVLLAGPTGSGKELAAGAFASLAERDILVHNAARFGSEDEASATLFGLAPRVFTGVEARSGIIEQADGRVLFIDESHTLPRRLQKSLLRVIEDRHVARIGETAEKWVDVRFVFASNEPPPRHGLAHDLVARLRVVEIPPLRERVADIPAIFNHFLSRAFHRTGQTLGEVTPHLTADHIESLCLDGFGDTNARGLIALAEELAGEVAIGTPPEAAVNRVFGERYRNGQVRQRQRPSFIASVFGKKKRDTHPVDAEQQALTKMKVDQKRIDLIKEAHTECRGVVTEMTAYLKKRHQFRISRGRLSKILDLLELPRLKRHRK